MKKPVESSSIFLVPEPYAESQPLLSLKAPNDMGRLEVDQIEATANNDAIEKTKGNKGSLNVCIGLYAVGEPTLKLNGVLGHYCKPPYRKQLITPHYWDFGSWESSSVRSVGFPSGCRDCGKFYCEVLLNEDPDRSLSVGVALGNYAPRPGDGTVDRNEGVWLVHGGDSWFANAQEKPDAWKTNWRAGQALCIAVDIDAKIMHIAIDGTQESRAYKFEPKGQAVYPIVVAETSFSRSAAQATGLGLHLLISAVGFACLAAYRRW